MKILKIIGLTLLVIIVALVLIGFLLPSEFSVEEEVFVEAPPEFVYDYLYDFRRWPEWTIWATYDPDARYVYSGPDGGVGQTTEWSGNEQVGEGKMEITAAEPPRSLEYTFEMADMDLQFQSEMLVEPSNGGSLVAWTSGGDVGPNLPARYMVKVFSPYMSKDLRAGLERLKSVAEADHSAHSMADTTDAVAAP